MSFGKLLGHTARAAVVGVLLLTGASVADARPRVYIGFGPPAPIVQVRPVAPGRGYIWRPGYHRYYHNSYVWTPGAWVVPPHRHARWVSPRWRHNRHGWYVVDGRWR